MKKRLLEPCPGCTDGSKEHVEKNERLSKLKALGKRIKSILRKKLYPAKGAYEQAILNTALIEILIEINKEF